MDVSRIEAYNPNKINWRNLTAKEIMKYENLGVEVPSVYLQWAQNFLNSVESYSNDDVTYEKAQTIASSNQENNVEAEQNIQTQDNSSESVQTSEQDLSPAQKHRNNMIDNGANLRAQAIAFTNDSDSASKESSAVSILLNLLSDTSSNELTSLENDMKAILSEAASAQAQFKAEIAKVNEGKSDKSTIDKINELNQLIKNFGLQAHQSISDSEGVFSQISADITSKESIFFNAVDFGSETVNVGSDLMNESLSKDVYEQMINTIVAKNAMSAGSASVDNGNQGFEIQENSLQLNESNLSSAIEIHDEVEDKTGVKTPANNDKDTQRSSSSRDELTGEKFEKDKDVKSSNNDGTDTNDKINTSIDEILKRKVRKGIQQQNGV